MDATPGTAGNTAAAGAPRTAGAPTTGNETAEVPAMGRDAVLGQRALQTRQKIIDTTKRLFLEYGYAGTSVNDITSACGISRAGFYTYFKDKRDVFDVIGNSSFHDHVHTVEQLDRLPRHPDISELTGWVRLYFEFLNEHGAVLLSSDSTPTTDDVQEVGRRMSTRVSWLIGMHLRSRQNTPSEAPDALGLATLSMLARSWQMTREDRTAVSAEDVIRAISEYLLAILRA